MPMNTANKQTLLRVFLIPVFLVVAYWGFPAAATWRWASTSWRASPTCWMAYIARHYNQVHLPANLRHPPG